MFRTTEHTDKVFRKRDIVNDHVHQLYSRRYRHSRATKTIPVGPPGVIQEETHGKNTFRPRNITFYVNREGRPFSA